MSLARRIRGLYQWYRALRSLQRIMATMTLVLLLVSACSGGEGPTGLDARAKVMLVNGTDHSAWYVFTRACGTSAWSDNLLGTDIVYVGDARSFSVAPGCRDVRVETDPALAGSTRWTKLDLSPGKVDTLKMNVWSYEM